MPKKAATAQREEITVEGIFGPGGLLEKRHPGYEFRPSQLAMAKIATDAFEKHQHVVIEAGTGTGKTLAYLLPAIRSGRRVVISTATKSLQEQLFQKDVPFLQKHFAPNLKAALMKGRANFLCRQKVHQMEGQPVLKGIDEIDWFSQIKDWEKLTETGDRSELTFLPDDAELWNRIDARSDLCTGQKCAEFQRCFVTAMHQRAHEADLIIVNHHLFFADLAIRQDDFGSILPEYSAVVFDEAHEIEDVASDYFGRRLSSYQFEELARDTESMLRILRIEASPLRKHLARLRERSRAFFERFPEREGRYPFGPAERHAFLDQNREAYDDLAAAVKRTEAELSAISPKPEEIIALARRAAETRRELAFLMESEEKSYVYWYERRGRGVFLAATPIDVSDILREKLFDQFDTVILTSATLAVGGRFDYLKQRLGVLPSQEEVLPQEFDYEQQALLYLPKSLPDVRNPAFRSQRSRRNRAPARNFARTRLLPFHKLRPDEGYPRARFGAREFSAAAAGHGAALDPARPLPLDAERRSLRDVELLAGSGRARRAALVRDHRQAALRGAERPDRRRARAGAHRRRTQRLRRISGARGGARAQAGLRPPDPLEDRPRHPRHPRQPHPAHAIW